MRTWPRAMPALVTPFTGGGDIDLDAHTHNITAMAERGARGVLLAGSTGEGPYLDAGERATLIEAAKRAAPDLIVFCGVNAEATRQADRMVAEVADAGADAALVITPTTVARGREDSVESFYAECAEAADVPIFLYSVPMVTAYELPTSTINRLAGHPNIAGMKDSGGDPDRLTFLSEPLDSGFVVYTGASAVLARSHALGAWGAITATANYAIADVSLACRGDREAQRRLSALAPAIEAHGVAGTKHAATTAGLRGGHLRAPLTGLDPAAADAIDSLLRTHGLASPE